MAPRLREAKGWILTKVITYFWVSALYILILSVIPTIRMGSPKYLNFIYLNCGKKKQMQTRSSIHNLVAKRKPECPYSTPDFCDAGAVLLPIKLASRLGVDGRLVLSKSLPPLSVFRMFNNVEDFFFIWTGDNSNYSLYYLNVFSSYFQ